MPELPEVEVTRLGLDAALCGAHITALRLGKPLRWPLQADPQTLHGLRIDALQRRGKYLLMRTAQGTLIVHLGMSGSLRWTPAQQPLPPASAHDHVELQTDRGVLRLRDPRRFGAVIWHPGTEVHSHPLLRALGPEPLSERFDGAALCQALRGRSAAIKPLLLSQHIVAGVGNIYACEALFRARIDPRTPASRLRPADCQRLATAVRETLQQAVALGGSSLRDFAHTNGHLGDFQLQAQVYGRAGQPCHVCGTPVRSIVQAQRSTYFCPNCQKILKSRSPGGKR
ncbi:bifunctional DNA-formamidopyrimidine glycosylase/DNA-(apurinic or apyrimidinic site) lyase [Thiomonas sp.]|uniref:bifunctional DNA-formamidopyrimidine glycosylase/DNA-(apurinic or apyrimidinic site) lyase n=1 Tax=Thiomonas sp. TaxID=2047785 RepID=UPI00260CE16D|nr:bifunctional DNA-formamidopyrimidine glycosylase/DNA-(apurinic or apyrimidinic site) lyase [Thiomonas sp.]